MSKVDEIRRLLEKCSDEHKREIFHELRDVVELHPFEAKIKAKAEIILEALDRAPKLTLLGIRGIIGEATFAIEIVGGLKGWRDVTPPGNHGFDTELKDKQGCVKVQVKMQRREKDLPLIKDGFAVVEVQRTRTGKKDGEDTRPYRFGTFDILAVCMEPSHRRWNSFLYIPERWLLARPKNAALIKVMQPVPLHPDDLYTDNFDEAVKRLRSGAPRPLNK